MTAKTCRKPKRMQFTASPDFYQLADDATALDVTDQIHARQRQLEALLMATTINEGGEEGFYGALSPSQQADYMSACHSLAVEIGELTKMLADMARGEES